MKKIIFLFSVIFWSCLNAGAQVEFSSHRGSSLHAPECTVAAVRLAWEQGTDAVEIDVQLSKDKKLMVIHDGNTKRTSGKDYVVRETHSDTLRLLDVGSFKGDEYKGEKIPFLEEILETIPPSKKLYIEMKCGVEGLPYVQKIIDASPKKDQLEIICFNLDVLIGVKKILPNTGCHLLVGGKDNVEESIKMASLNGIDAIDMSHSLITKEIVDQIHKLNMGIYAWTVDNPEIAKKLIKLNVDGIESNCVPCLKEDINLISMVNGMDKDMGMPPR